MTVDDILLRDGAQLNHVQDDILFVALANSKLKDELNGEIRKCSFVTDTTPVTHESCTISSLPLPIGSVQLGTSHVNLIIPDIPDTTMETEGKAVTYSRNDYRVKYITELALEALKDHYSGNGWSFTLDMQDTIAEPQMQAHRIWLKFTFVFHN